MDPQALARIEKLNYLLGGGLLLIVSPLTSLYFVYGVAVGVALTCINFTLIRRLVDKLLRVAPDKRGAAAFIFIPKMVGLLGAAGLAMFFLPISAIGMGIGFSIFFVSFMVESVRFMTGAALTR